MIEHCWLYTIGLKKSHTGATECYAQCRLLAHSYSRIGGELVMMREVVNWPYRIILWTWCLVKDLGLYLIVCEFEFSLLHTTSRSVVNLTHTWRYLPRKANNRKHITLLSKTGSTSTPLNQHFPNQLRTSNIQPTTPPHDHETIHQNAHTHYPSPTPNLPRSNLGSNTKRLAKSFHISSPHRSLRKNRWKYHRSM